MDNLFPISAGWAVKPSMTNFTQAQSRLKNSYKIFNQSHESWASLPNPTYRHTKGILG